MPDKYPNFRDLSSEEAAGAYRVISRIRNSWAIILAPHGGRIEIGTSEIARMVAGDDLSLYLFEGLKTTGNIDLHITSSHFDEPSCLMLLASSHAAVSIHGRRGNDEFVEVGGRPSPLKEGIAGELKKLDIDVRAPSRGSLAGTDLNNVTNRTIDGYGVQLEFSRGLRDRFRADLRRNSDGLFAQRLTIAIREPIQALSTNARVLK